VTPVDPHNSLLGTARPVPRRQLLLGAATTTAAVAGGALLGAPASAAAAPDTILTEIPATENLMREHGVLKRLLLVYEEVGRRISARQPVPAGALSSAAGLIHDYIEGFHEALEEGYVFPRLRQAGVLVSTVDTLLTQHARGRQLTQAILASATRAGLARASTRASIASNLTLFVRMYEPHEAREDTVMFPAYRSLLSGTELAEMAELFSSEQSARFGKNGFAKVVTEVSRIETTLGIADLNQFTPPGH
jgi:hemerythrin-like domain-containing protein